MLSTQNKSCNIIDLCHSSSLRLSPFSPSLYASYFCILLKISLLPFLWLSSAFLSSPNVDFYLPRLNNALSAVLNNANSIRRTSTAVVKTEIAIIIQQFLTSQSTTVAIVRFNRMDNFCVVEERVMMKSQEVAATCSFFHVIKASRFFGKPFCAFIRWKT